MGIRSSVRGIAERQRDSAEASLERHVEVLKGDSSERSADFYSSLPLVVLEGLRYGAAALVVSVTELPSNPGDPYGY